MSGMSQDTSANGVPAPPCTTVSWGASVARSRRSIGSALHEVDLVEVDVDPVPVDEQDDGQADAHLGGGDGDDEQGEDLAGDVAQPGGEGDEVDVHGIEHELHAHEHEHAVAP